MLDPKNFPFVLVILFTTLAPAASVAETETVTGQNLDNDTYAKPGCYYEPASGKFKLVPEDNSQPIVEANLEEVFDRRYRCNTDLRDYRDFKINYGLKDSAREVLVQNRERLLKTAARHLSLDQQLEILQGCGDDHTRDSIVGYTWNTETIDNGATNDNPYESYSYQIPIIEPALTSPLLVKGCFNARMIQEGLNLPENFWQD